MTGLPRWVYTFVIVTVTAIWAVLNVLDVLLSAYMVPAQVQITMGVVAGAALGGNVIKAKRDRED